MRDIDAADFGANGKSTLKSWVDETAALQAALDAAASTGATLHLKPRAMYVISSPLVVDGAHVRIDGHSAQIVTTNEPQLAVLALKGGAWLEASHLIVNASGVAKYALHAAGAGGSRFTDCLFTSATHDAVHLAAEGANGGNDCMRFERCQMQHSGRQRRFTATVTETDRPSTSAYATEPLLEAPDAQFITWGVRTGDLLRIGAGAAEWLMVQDVIDETHLRLQLYPGSAGHHDAPAVLHIGDGYHEAPYNDNNLVELSSCILRGNAANGARLGGLFGARIDRTIMDFNGAYGAVVGHRNGPVIISQFSGCYFEGNGAPTAFLLGGAQGVEISSPNTDVPLVAVTNPATSWGTILNAQDKPGLRNATANWVGSGLPSQGVAL